jgi:hypothetical protein
LLLSLLLSEQSGWLDYSFFIAAVRGSRSWCSRPRLLVVVDQLRQRQDDFRDCLAGLLIRFAVVISKTLPRVTTMLWLE